MVHHDAPALRCLQIDIRGQHVALGYFAIAALDFFDEVVDGSHAAADDLAPGRMDVHATAFEDRFP